MFQREDNTYLLSEEMIIDMMTDEASPHCQISKIIKEGDKILDIGAGNGILAQILKRKYSNVYIDGIEPNKLATSIASKYYNNIYCGYFEQYIDIISQSQYDYIILADVIEHMADPLDMLRKLISVMSDKTSIVLSVPNIAFGSVRFALLQGNFDYVNSGLLEKTHLRFFTYKTLKKLINNLPVNINKIFFLQRSLFSTEIQLNDLKINRSTFRDVISDKLAYVYQFLVVVNKQTREVEEISCGKRDTYPYIKYFIIKSKVYKYLKSQYVLYKRNN